jgi:sugar phosphate isomerase/epimerase
MPTHGGSLLTQNCDRSGELATTSAGGIVIAGTAHSSLSILLRDDTLSTRMAITMTRSVGAQFNRRRFLTGAAVVAGAVRKMAAEGNGRPRIGCVSWNFHSLAPGAHPEEAIDIVGSLGFEGIELIANSRKDIDEYWTDATISRIKKQLERNHLVLNQFPFFQPVVEGLTSRNAEERQRCLDYFERGCRIANKLGAPIVNIVAPWARELSSPSGGYLPRYFINDPKPGEKFHINIVPGFEFDEMWNLFTQTMKACGERAQAHGMKFSIENHTHTMVPVTDSFLRLWDTVRDAALGCNLDCGWAMNQREPA